MAKQEWLEDKCKSVEECLTREKIDTAYRKIKDFWRQEKQLYEYQELGW